MHQITGFRFMDKGPKRFVIYTTKYESGRYGSIHDCTGMTDEQARGRFIVEHSHEVDRLKREQQSKQRQTSQLILNN